MGQTDKIIAPELYIAISIFGTSAKRISAIEKACVRPCETHTLAALRTILSTDSLRATRILKCLQNPGRISQRQSDSGATPTRPRMPSSKPRSMYLTFFQRGPTITANRKNFTGSRIMSWAIHRHGVCGNA